MSSLNSSYPELSRESDFGRNLARRIRDLDVEINSLEGSRDRVAELLDEFDDRLNVQKKHRAGLLARQDELLP